MNDFKTIAVVPARGGSKGFPRKNLAMLRGKPLLAYAIEAGLACPAIGRVIVSTDDQEIADCARKHGAEVPFMRPSEIAQDDTPDRPVFLHLIDWLRRNENYEFDGLVNLRCTTPFKKASDLAAILEILRDEDCSAVRSVTRIDGKNHPYWVLSRDSEGYAKQFVDGIDLHKYCRRQLLPPAYALNGVIDAMKCRVIEASPNFYGDRIMLYETDPLMSVDVDSPKDLALCERLTEVKA